MLFDGDWGRGFGIVSFGEIIELIVPGSPVFKFEVSVLIRESHLIYEIWLDNLNVVVLFHAHFAFI